MVEQKRKTMKQYLLSRLAEASTWRGIFLILSAFGIHEFSPDQETALTTLIVAIFGGLHFAPDTIGKPK